MATQLFSWDVETGALADFFDLDVGTHVSISTEQALSGTKSIKYTSAGSDNCACALGTGKTEFYAKWKWWFSSTTDVTAAGRHGFRISQRSGDQYFNHHEFDTVPDGGNWGFDILDHDGGFDSGSTYHGLITLPEDQWFTFEIYLKLGTPGASDGIVRAWVNSVLAFEDTTVQFVGSAGWTQFDTFALTSNFDTGTALWYHDDVEVWDGMPDGDSTAPILSSASAGTPNSGGATGAGVTTDEGNGTLYWAVVTNGGSATDAQLKAGTGGNIVSGKAGNQAVSGTGAQVISNITGLTASTAYQIKFLHADAAANDSSQASVNLTTTAATPSRGSMSLR